MGLLQSELDETRELWNNLHIREAQNSECSAGHPDVLSVNMTLNLEAPFAKTGSLEEMLKFELIVIAENNFEDLPGAVESKELYLKIISGLQEVIH